MADLHGDGPAEQHRRKGTGKRHISDSSSSAASTELVVNPPCGACKFLRRKCVSGCIFAPHFGSDQGAARFAAVHKVFGASNVSKLLLHIPMNRRHHAVITISYEAQARLSDPVYGCVSTVLALQQQVASLQAELAMVQNQLMMNSSRIAAANHVMQSSLQQHQQQDAHQHHHHHTITNNNIGVLQPAYSNSSSAVSNNNVIHLNMSNFNTTAFGGESCALSSQSFDPLQLSTRCGGHHDEEEDDDEECGNGPLAFANHILRSS